MKYSLCIGAYEDKDVIYHLEKVKEHGFHGLEYYHWWDLDLTQVAKKQEQLGVGINATCTRYFNLVDEQLREQYLVGLKETIEACKRLGIQSIITQTGNYQEGVDRTLQQNTMIETLKQCADMCEKANVTLELEPLNNLDHQGHFLQKSAEAAYIIDQVNHSHVRFLYDVYHQQITEGDIIRNLTAHTDRISHYHIADNPGRNEPGTGELNFINILKAIKQTDYDGFVGLECGYTIDTDQALNTLKQTILEKIEIA